MFRRIGASFIVFSILAAGMVYQGAMAWKSKQQESWPHVGGQVTSGTIDTQGYKISHWEAHIGYRYLVEGIEHTGETDIWASSKPDASKDLEVYPLSAAVEIYYDPRNPADSTILPGSKFEHAIIGLLTWAGYGLFLAIYAQAPARDKETKKEKPHQLLKN